MDFRLPWREIDPRRRPALDVEVARRRAEAALRRKPMRTSVGREQAEDELKFLIWSELGAWCGGWHRPIDAGGASGVWTGPASVGDDEAATADRVVAALEGWQQWLVELAERFDELAASTAELDEVDTVARVAAELLTPVLERTGARGEWHRTYAEAVSWGVQACGRADEDVRPLIESAVEAHVEAGAAPSSEATQALVDDVALEVAARDRPPFTDDALETWWTVRADAPWGSPVPPNLRPAEGDAHRRYIREHDRPFSTVRADAMTRALVRARYGAKQRLKLDRALLEEWLELALVSKDFSLRRGEVQSKDEGERYGRPKDLEKRLKRALDDAIDDAVPSLSRAARAYLDLRFLSPFTDGNSRIARLTFDYVLSRDGMGLHDATPIFGVRRWAHDTSEPWRFQRLLAKCAGPV